MNVTPDEIRLRVGQDKIITKGEVDFPEYETRYFGKTDDGFDGTAQGYGYKSIEKLNKAYWFFKNKDKINANKNKAKRFLKDNLDVKKCLLNYFDADNAVYAWKNSEELSFADLLESLEKENNSDIINKLNNVKHLWKTLEREL